MPASINETVFGIVLRLSSIWYQDWANPTLMPTASHACGQYETLLMRGYIINLIQVNDEYRFIDVLGHTGESFQRWTTRSWCHTDEFRDSFRAEPMWLTRYHYMLRKIRFPQRIEPRETTWLRALRLFQTPLAFLSYVLCTQGEKCKTAWPNKRTIGTYRPPHQICDQRRRLWCMLDFLEWKRRIESSTGETRLR